MICTAMGIINPVKREPTECHGIFAGYTYNRELTSSIQKPRRKTQIKRNNQVKTSK